MKQKIGKKVSVMPILGEKVFINPIKIIGTVVEVKAAYFGDVKYRVMFIGRPKKSNGFRPIMETVWYEEDDITVIHENDSIEQLLTSYKNLSNTLKKIRECKKESPSTEFVDLLEKYGLIETES